MTKHPDFFLGERLEYRVTDFDGRMRSCFVISQLRPRDSEVGSHYLWVRVDPLFHSTRADRWGSLS
jgi:hypothetical protein